MKKIYVILAIVLSVFFVNSAISQGFVIGAIHEKSLATTSKEDYLKLQEYLDAGDHASLYEMKNNKKLFVVNAGVLIKILDVDTDCRGVKFTPLETNVILWTLPYGVQIGNKNFKIFRYSE